MFTKDTSILIYASPLEFAEEYVFLNGRTA
jgi:hypothetical protein